MFFISFFLSPAHHPPQLQVQSRKSGKKKKKLASFDPAVTIMGTESNLAPSIYQSPVIRCVFTVGNLDDETYCYEPAKQPSSKIDARWCGPESGVDPWRVAQRLAVKPRQVRDHYVKCGFSKLSNVNPTAPCLESLSGERGELAWPGWGACGRWRRFWGTRLLSRRLLLSLPALAAQVHRHRLPREALHPGRGQQEGQGRTHGRLLCRRQVGARAAQAVNTIARMSVG